MKVYSSWQESIIYAPISKYEVVGMITSLILTLWWLL